MKNKKPLIDEDGEVREIDAEDFKQFKPIAEVSPGLLKTIRRGRGKQIAQIKEAVSIRLSTDVTEYFRSTGKGWQTRLDDVLLEYVSGRK